MVKKKDEIIEETPELDYKEIHETPIRELAKEEKVEEKPEVEEKKEEKVEKKEEKEPKSPLDEAKEYVAAQKAEQAKKDEELKKELDEIKKSALTKEEKKEEEKKIKAKWSEEDRSPKDYDEIYEEARKAGADEGFEKAKKWFEEQKEAEKAETEKQKTEREAQETKVKEQNAEYLKNVDNKIGEELEELYEGGHLPRPKDETDPEDEGVKIRTALFKQGMEINQQRIKEGKPVIDSVAKIFFMHYKKEDKQPAGADAPIAGANTPVKVEPKDQYNYAEDHKKSFRQILHEAIRGKK